jgi:branched-chain amino acid transport system ATP-binding protein
MSAGVSETGGLAIEGVRAGYGRTVVLDGISLSLAPGATLALLGRNGVGKTTLLSTVMGLTTLHGGSIRFGGADLAGMPPYARCRTGVGFVPQEREIFPSLTLEENIVVAARPGRWPIERVYEFFPTLAERRRNRGNELSGGEQQMLAIARALVTDPALLLMDEPLEGLAPVIVDALLAGLNRLKREDALALLVVEQHARLALEFAEAAVILDRGRMVYSGSSRDLLEDPQRLTSLVGIARR